MSLNLPLLAATLVAAALFVLRDARRRRAAEAQASDDWELRSPHPWLWAALALVFAPVALPAYLLLTRQPRRAALAAVAVTLGCGAAGWVAPTDRVEWPFAAAKPAVWSSFPPGLPAAARKAAEQLPLELALSVQKILPGLIDFGRGYEQGAEITIQPGLDEARVILELKAEGFRVMTAVRVFGTAAQAATVLAAEIRGKDTRPVPGDGGRALVLDGPRPRADAAAGLKLNSYELHANVLMHLLVVGPGVSPEGDATIEAFAAAVSANLARRIAASDDAGLSAH